MIFSYLTPSNSQRHCHLYPLALVSRDWNESATRLLYEDIFLEWDSRVGSHLVRTLDAKPSLLPLIRSLGVYFPRLEGWSGLPADLVERETVVYDQLAREYLAGLSEDERGDTDGGYDGISNDIEEIVRPEWMAYTESEGAGAWMDVQADGDGPKRREGARHFLQLVGRCSHLQNPCHERLQLSD